MEFLQLLVTIYGFVINICLLARLRYSTPAILLIFVPFVNLFALGVFAFRRSPIEEELSELRERVQASGTEMSQQGPAPGVPPSAPGAFRGIDRGKP
jgi:hypothetical protein